MSHPEDEDFVSTNGLYILPAIVSKLAIDCLAPVSHPDHGVPSSEIRLNHQLSRNCWLRSPCGPNDAVLASYDAISASSKKRQKWHIRLSTSVTCFAMLRPEDVLRKVCLHFTITSP